ncbi:hypothetical protein QMK33_11945 [Hymenobacter sp. H14-R3]|uniref:hypothetical protein n=1 Tax=Hymenobacter sp. H14-R3 TaxID=3046308 RepID=UPI0024B8FE10|nr:hypothetical protein [Hymenobacter sp. H14-R3]MDJ0365866.1 hypothetical protein [Hymenobacter sp. H14-R3]
MKTDPFYATPLPGETPSPAQRLPYHDPPACPEGQRVRQRGHWRPCEPARVANTRVWCPACRAFGALSA